MAHLERFLDIAADEGARFVRDLPESCVPIRRGEVTGSLEGLVSAAGPPPEPYSGVMSRVAALRRDSSWKLASIVAIAIFLALAVQAYAIKPYRIPSGRWSRRSTSASACSSSA